MDILSQQKPQASTVVTTPSTQAFGDSAAIGTATDYARGDHKHAMPANPVPNWGYTFLLMGA